MVIDKKKLLGIAQKYILKGQSKKAIKEYLTLVEATPKDTRLHLKLGDLYLKNGDTQNAIEEYLKLAELYAEEDLNSRAISIYTRVLSIDPNSVEAFHKIAQLYLKEGLSGSARNCYQSILKIKPDDQEASDALRSIEDQKPPPESRKPVPPPEPLPPKHRHGEEKKVIAEKPSLAPSPPKEILGLPDEAEAAPLDKDSEMHYHLGVAYKEMELFDYAISEFELASSNAAIKFDCCTMLGDCFMEKGEYDKSIAHYKTASDIKGLPTNKLARLYFNLGLAYEMNGMVPEAMSAFHNVLNLDDSFEQAHEKIRKLQEK